MTRIRVGLIFLLLLLIFPVTVWADAHPQEWEGALPPIVAELLEKQQPAHETLNRGLQNIWNLACSSLQQVVRESVQGIAWMLAAVLLCGIGEGIFQRERPWNFDLVSMVGAAVITLAAAGNLKNLVGLGWSTIGELNVFSKALLPTLGAAVAASGGMVSASVKQMATVFFSDLMITVIQQLLLPMVYCYIAVSAADTMLEQPRLGRFGEGIRKLIIFFLTGGLLLFTAYLGISGVLTGSADHLALQITRTAIGAVLPVVGNILSGASESLLAGAGVVKNTIGIAGLLGVIAITILPVLKLSVQYLLYKVTSFLTETVAAPPLARLVRTLGSAFGLVLGMTGTCALLLIISVASSISVVSI